MQDVWFDMVSYTAQYMAASIAAKGLDLSGQPGGDAWLKNSHCALQLSNVENDCVEFQIHNSLNEGSKFYLTSFLDCCFMQEGGSSKLDPNPPSDWTAEKQFVAMLENYDRLLLGGYLDAPLAGDFSWVPTYHAMLAEVERLSMEAFYLGKAGHPEAEAILDKEVAGDLSWMDDVRRILAEQEAKA